VLSGASGVDDVAWGLTKPCIRIDVICAGGTNSTLGNVLAAGTPSSSAIQRLMSASRDGSVEATRVSSAENTSV
jgi:hypothetical protein